MARPDVGWVLARPALVPAWPWLQARFGCPVLNSSLTSAIGCLCAGRCPPPPLSLRARSRLQARFVLSSVPPLLWVMGAPVRGGLRLPQGIALPPRPRCQHDHGYMARLGWFVLSSRPGVRRVAGRNWVRRSGGPLLPRAATHWCHTRDTVSHLAATGIGLLMALVLHHMHVVLTWLQAGPFGAFHN